MYSMTEKMEELMTELDEVVNVCMKQISMSMFSDMSMDELLILQKCASLMVKSKSLAMAQAEMMDETNRKLDKLLTLMEKQA